MPCSRVRAINDHKPWLVVVKMTSQIISVFGPTYNQTLISTKPQRKLQFMISNQKQGVGTLSPLTATIRGSLKAPIPHMKSTFNSNIISQLPHVKPHFTPTLFNC
jgi:hypothetical protein